MARRILNGTTSANRLDASSLGAGDWAYGRLYDGDDQFIGSSGADRMAGDGGNDSLLGGLGNDSLLGGAGQDSLSGGEGEDLLDGGLGDDVLDGEAGDDQLLGGAGLDSLSGGDGADLLDGGDGNDSLFGGEGQDTLRGGAGDDRADGGAGDDLVNAGEGNNTVLGGTGDDSIVAGAGNDSIEGQEGDDLIATGDGSNVASGGAGDDDITGGIGNDTLSGDDGNDVISAGAGNDSVLGGAGADLIDTGEGNNWVDAGTGDDSVTAGSGNDTILAGEGDNTVLGGAGLDSITAGEGNDSILGEAGNDVINAGDGANRVSGGLGNDSIMAGAGNDSLSGDDGNDTLNAGDGDNTIQGGIGNDSVTAGLGQDSILGGDGDDVIAAGEGDNTVTGGAGLDRITAGSGADLLSGDDGNDTLKAGDGDNTVLGGSGKDCIITGAGADSILGGDGDDSIQAGDGANQVEGGIGVDRITTGTGDDTILGDAGNDIIMAGEGNNVIDGGDDQDVITAGSGDDDISGGAGNDSVQAGDGANFVEGEAGNDTIEAGAGDDWITGGVGADVIRAGDGANHVDAGSENDRVTTGLGDDNVLGGAGNDTISTGAGDDAAYGNDGNDQIMLGLGDDFASGDAGNDSILGGDGLDTLYGGLGNDSLAGEAGTDLIFGDAGNDLIIHALAQKGLVMDEFWGGKGTDTLRMDFTRAEWFLTTMQDEIVRLVGALNTPAALRGGEVISETFGATLRSVEVLAVTVDGVALTTADDPVTAKADAFTVVDGASVSGSLVGNDVVPDLIALVALNGAAPALGELLIAEHGGFTFTTGRAFESLAVGETQDVLFSYRVTDADGDTGAALVTLTVQGANDAAAITGNGTGSVTEDDAATASGTLTVLDVDHGEARFAVAASLAGSYGAFAFDAMTGVWSYALNSDLAQVQALNARQTLTDKLTVQSFDGTASQNILVTIQGANDAATISGTSTGAVTEDNPAKASGVLSVSDVDGGEARFAVPTSQIPPPPGPPGFPAPRFAAVESSSSTGPTSASSSTSSSSASSSSSSSGSSGGASSGSSVTTVAGAYGSFGFDALTGVWTYTLNSASPAVQALAMGQSLTDKLTVKSFDGTASQDILVTINGANDAASVSGTSAGSVAEDGTLTASGMLSVADPDSGEARFATPASLAGTYGSFSFNAGTGAWGYTLNNAAANVQALAAGQSVTDTVTVASLDGTASQVISVAIAGANDTATITISGATSVLPLISLNAVASGVGGYKIYGENMADQAGIAVTSVGDMNGDGLPEVLVGANLNGAGGFYAGAGYVVFGKAGGAAVNLDNVAAGTGGFKIIGENGQDRAGFSLSSIGDLNGDGRADLLISAPGNDAGGSDGGAVYVVWGKADGTTVNLDDVARGTGGYKIQGEGRLGADTAGYAVSGIGDLNGDGLPEILLTAPEEQSGGRSSGAAYVVFGKPSGGTVKLTDVANGTGGYKIFGEAVDNFLGYSIASVADLNGDGKPELLVGAHQNSQPNATMAGAAYLVFGKADGTAINLSSVAAGVGGFKIIGENGGESSPYSFYGTNSDQAGYAVASIGDLNGDGLAELVIAAPNNDIPDAINAGAVYVVWGKANTTTVNLDDVAGGIGGFKISGEIYDALGSAVSVIGDLNGDGLPELLVGSESDSGNFNNASDHGSAFVVFGKGTGTPVSTATISAGIGGYKIHAESSGGYAGRALGAIGDLNGDGLPEVLVSAYLNGGAGQEGAAYVVFGQAAPPAPTGVAEDGLLTLGGTITVADADAGQAGLVVPASLLGTYGSFTLNAGTGAWGYTLNNAAANVQALVTGQTVTDSIVIASTDGSASKALVVSIAGKDDAAVITGPATGSVAEDGTLTASGTLVVTDPDAGQAGFATPASLAGTYGTFGFNAGTGAWGYALANAAANVQGLKTGQSVTDSLVVKSLDGSASQTISVSIAGKDDAAVITGSGTGSVAEDGTLTASGTLSVADADAGQAGFATPVSLAGTYGTFSFNAGTGAWAYTLNNAAANVQGLKAGQSVTDSLTVSSLDGSASKIIAIGIAGANDVAAITISGATPVLPEISLNAVAAGVGGYKIIGEGFDDQAGTAIGSIGDLNGDGLGEVLINAPGVRNGSLGATYVVFGKADGATINLDDIAAGNGGYRISGVYQTELLTGPVASIADLNGDGLPEVLVGYAGGEAAVVWGQSGTHAISMADVRDGKAGFTITGGGTGYAIAAVKDLNGDGLADILVSSRYDSAGGTNAGAAYVVFGKASGANVDLTSVAAGVGGYKIIGENAGDTLGISVASVGDLNGDGKAELLIGTHMNDQGGTNAGAAYLVFGKSGGAAINLDNVAAGVGGFKIIGENGAETSPYSFYGTNADQAGFRVTSISDLNGDGLAELVIAAPYNDLPDAINAGAVYVVWGKANTTTVNLDDVAAGNGGFKISGEIYDGLGSAVSVIGDLNGDGLAELLVSSESDSGNYNNNSDHGSAYVVFGKGTGTAVSTATISAGIGGYKIHAESSGGYAGTSLGSIGDLNGDGLPEVLVSAYLNNNSGGGAAGAVYAVFGQAAPPAPTGVAEDGLLTLGGTITVADADAGQAGFATAASLSGTYGRFTLNAATGAWGYTLNNAAANVQALVTGQTVTDSIVIASTDGSASKSLVVSIAGKDDAAVIKGPATGSVAEDGTLTASGTLVVTDPDAGQAGFATPASLAGTYGTFGFNAGTGAWGYALANAAANVQGLKTGQSVTDSLVVKSLDGSASQTISVSIAGKDDAAVITGSGTGSVAEDGTLTASGTLSVADADAGQAGFATPASLAGSYGSFSFNAGTGAWAYTLNNAAVNVQGLKTGQSVTDSLAVTSQAGEASKTIQISIAGKDDVAIMAGSFRGMVVEATTLIPSGKVTVTDADAGQSGFTTPASLAGKYGTYSFNTGTGDWSYALNNSLAAVQALNNGQSLTDGLKIVSTDASSARLLVVTIQGKTEGAQWVQAINLDNVAAGQGGYKIFGENVGDQAGFPSTGLGDLNGDGLSEIFIGAHKNNAGGAISGAAYVVWGAAAGSAAVNLDNIAAGNGGFKIYGENADDQLAWGYGLGSVNDLNGDGKFDLIVAGRGNDNAGGTNAGAVYVVWGKSSGGAINLDSVAAGNGGYKIIGENGGDLLGSGGVGSIGDLNGDGKSEIVVVAPNNGGGGVNAGGAYVVWGKSDGTLVNLDDVAAGNGGYKITGENPNDVMWGMGISSDLNADGKGEILLVSLNDSTGGASAGAAYVVWGKSTGTGVNLDDVARGMGGFKIIGEKAGDLLSSIASVGDINGDGIGEILLGGEGDDVGGNNAGAAYVVWGKSSGTTVNLDSVALGIGGFKIYGENANDQVSRVQSLGDINGDGLADLGIQAYWNDNGGGANAGAAYVVWGKADGTAINLDSVANGVGGFKIYGENLNDLAGIGLSVITDLNGDGISDLLVGALQNDNAGGSDAGATYVVYSQSSWHL